MKAGLHTFRAGRISSRGAAAARNPARRRRLGGAVRPVLTASEFHQLGARHHKPHAARTEVHGQGNVLLDADDPAEAVGIVVHLIPQRELLSGRRG